MKTADQNGCEFDQAADPSTGDVVQIDDLTEEQAREWLMVNDPEAKDFWASQPAGALVDAVRQDLNDWGDDDQSDLCFEVAL